MVIAAAWLFLHPRKYGLNFPRVQAKPALLRLDRPASIYELTICLGSGGTREGFLRALRNLNPRYQADSWLPAGTTLNATAQIVGLYGRYCVRGARAELAHQLVMSDPSAAVVQVGNAEPVALGGVGLVEGLEGTGGDCNHDCYRDMLAQQMRKDRVPEVEKLLHSPNHALVIVEAHLPPGACKGDRIDVEVKLPPGSQATSLRGGVLRKCYLYNYDFAHNLLPNYKGDNSMHLGHRLAIARGPILVGTGDGEVLAADHASCSVGIPDLLVVESSY